jgi:hypothetical protein
MAAALSRLRIPYPMMMFGKFYVALDFARKFLREVLPTGKIAVRGHCMGGPAGSRPIPL